MATPSGKLACARRGTLTRRGFLRATGLALGGRVVAGALPAGARRAAAAPTYTMTQFSDPARTFAEATAAHPVASTTWVRLLAAPFAGAVDTAWLDAALADASPDLLAIAMQYVAGAPDRYDGAGLRVAGDASYGPLQADGTRKEGSDFNDYLGVAWAYGGATDRPEADERGSLDCSGFTRMVCGYRGGIPLILTPNGTAIPRRATQQHTGGPGVLTINSAVQVTDFGRLQPGDLVCFDADPGDGPQVDHVGSYLGPDTGGHQRFLSSRKSANGPTLGDTSGKSILDGTGRYAKAFRAARRL